MERNTQQTVIHVNIQSSCESRKVIKRIFMWSYRAKFSQFSSEVIITLHRIFFLKIGGHKSFCGATDTPDLDFWWGLNWVSKLGWIPLYATLPVHNGFLRFTSGVTSPDLLVASMVAELFHLHTGIQALVGLEYRIKCAISSKHVVRQMLYQLS